MTAESAVGVGRDTLRLATRALLAGVTVFALVLALSVWFEGASYERQTAALFSFTVALGVTTWVVLDADHLAGYALAVVVGLSAMAFLVLLTTGTFSVLHQQVSAAYELYLPVIYAAGGLALVVSSGLYVFDASAR